MQPPSLAGSKIERNTNLSQISIFRMIQAILYGPMIIVIYKVNSLSLSFTSPRYTPLQLAYLCV